MSFLCVCWAFCRRISGLVRRGNSGGEGGHEKTRHEAGFLHHDIKSNYILTAGAGAGFLGFQPLFRMLVSGLSACT